MCTFSYQIFDYNHIAGESLDISFVFSKFIKN